jgi:mannose-1-phosphate guanylyltransferase
MDAILLVGGFGTRLRPLTNRLPKPLIPLANVPFLNRMLDWLRGGGVTHVVLCLHYNAPLFHEHLEWHDPGMDITFAVEDEPLGTGGAIRHGAQYLRGDTCVVLNGDIFTNLDLNAMREAHVRRGALATLALQRVADAARFGVIESEPDGRISAFREKPPAHEARDRDINAGVYIYQREIFGAFPSGPHSVERDVYPKLVTAHAPIFGYRERAYWTDLGTPTDYLQAHHDILAGHVKIDIPADEASPGVWIGQDVRIDDSAQLIAPVLIGPGARIGAEARVGPYVSLGARTQIGARATVRESVIWSGARIRPDSIVDGSLIGRRARVDGRVTDYVCGDRERVRPAREFRQAA